MNQYLIILSISIVLFILLFLTRNTNEGFYQRPRISLKPMSPKPSNGPTVVVAGDASRKDEIKGPLQKQIPFIKQVVSSAPTGQKDNQAIDVSRFRPPAPSPSVAQPVPAPVAQAVAAPVAQPVPAPVSQAVSQPVAQAAPAPVAQAVAAPVSQAVSQPVAQAVSQPVAQAAPAPTTEVNAAPAEAVTTGITNNMNEVETATTADPNQASTADSTLDTAQQSVNNTDASAVLSVQTGQALTDSAPASIDSTENNTTSGFTGNIFNLRNLFSF